MSDKADITHIESSNAQKTALCFFAIIGLTVLAFVASIQFDFISYDDPAYITENPRVNSGLSLSNAKWAATSTGTTNLWHPITFMSHQLDVSLFGLTPKWHHAVNVFWHAIAAGLLFLIATRLTKSHLLGFFIALIWAIHPEKIQSVAWLSERKDLLSGAFFFASIYSFMKWKMKPHWFLYMLSLGFFAAALMSKPSVVTLPLVLFVLFYAEKKFFRSVTRSLPALSPFIIASLVAATATIYFQSIGALGNVSDHLSIAQKAMKIPVSFTFYLERFVWPNPSQLWFYPPTSNRELAISLAILGPLIPLFTWLCVKEKLIAYGVALYTILWLPVSGLVTVGYYFVADRYSYLPMLGIVLILAGLVKFITRPKRNFIPATIILTIITAGFGFLQQKQLPIWKNDKSLFANEMEINPRSLLAPIHYGAIFNQSDPEKALSYFKKAHEIDKESGLALMNMGISQKKLDRKQEALVSFGKGTKVRMPMAENWTRLLILQAELDLNDEAEITIQDGIEKFPNEWPLIVNSASYFLTKKDKTKQDLLNALELFNRSHSMKKNNKDAILGCASAHFELGNIELAKEYLLMLTAEQQKHPLIQKMLQQ